MSGRKTAGAVIKQTEPAVVAERCIFGLRYRNYKDLRSGEIAIFIAGQSYGFLKGESLI